MAQSFTGKKRIRKSFGRIPEAVQMPNLIEVQRSSYEQFLQRETRAGDRREEGIEAVFRSVFPIKDFNERAVLEYVSYEFEEPKYDVEECVQRDMTYAAPLKVKLRLIVFETDEETGARSVKDIKEQDVYMGDIPLMTEKGTFIVNGTQRVIVSQMHRSPGVFFDHDKGKTHSSGKLLFAARVIPYRGSWLDFEFDAKDVVYVRIDRRRKLPATTFLMGLGMDGEEILSTFYETVTFEKRTDPKKGDFGWTAPYKPERWRGAKPDYPLIDAETGEEIAPAGQKISARNAKKFADAGLKTLLLAPEALNGKYLARDLVNFETGEIYAEAGDELDATVLQGLEDQGFSELDILDVDETTMGAYIRNTLRIDKNNAREDALFDIYRVMRPGEPPTVEAAEAMFKSLFFDGERYDLSAVGRVKMNMRLELDCPDDVRILRKEDVLAVLQTLVGLRDGKGEIDDIDNLGNRRVRAVGELLENQYRVGLLRMERAIKERMSSVDIDTVMPHDLINAKPAAAAVREFVGSSQLSQFMDQTNPLSEITHKRRLSALGPGG
ncbi:MAG: DNA-directed RNA polymerase subunit beta, partial [Phenylobacterium sp.]|nr:DNA-directed RNA polymerase subunit beta [Phenylobacterium sp.]